MPATYPMLDYYIEADVLVHSNWQMDRKLAGED